MLMNASEGTKLLWQVAHAVHVTVFPHGKAREDTTMTGMSGAAIVVPHGDAYAMNLQQPAPNLPEWFAVCLERLGKDGQADLLRSPVFRVPKAWYMAGHNYLKEVNEVLHEVVLGRGIEEQLHEGEEWPKIIADCVVVKPETEERENVKGAGHEGEAGDEDEEDDGDEDEDPYERSGPGAAIYEGPATGHECRGHDADLRIASAVADDLESEFGVGRQFAACAMRLDAMIETSKKVARAEAAEQDDDSVVEGDEEGDDDMDDKHNEKTDGECDVYDQIGRRVLEQKCRAFLGDIKKLEKSFSDAQLREEAAARAGDEDAGTAKPGCILPPQATGLTITSGSKLLSLFDRRTMVLIAPWAFTFGDGTYRCPQRLKDPYATHMDLEECIRMWSLREELEYEVPPPPGPTRAADAARDLAGRDVRQARAEKIRVAELSKAAHLDASAARAAATADEQRCFMERMERVGPMDEKSSELIRGRIEAARARYQAGGGPPKYTPYDERPECADDRGAESESDAELVVRGEEAVCAAAAKPELEEPLRVAVANPGLEEPLRDAAAEPGAEEPARGVGTRSGVEEPVRVAAANPGLEEPLRDAAAKPGAEEPVRVAAAMPAVERSDESDDEPLVPAMLAGERSDESEDELLVPEDADEARQEEDDDEALGSGEEEEEGEGTALGGGAIGSESSSEDGSPAPRTRGPGTEEYGDEGEEARRQRGGNRWTNSLELRNVMYTMWRLLAVSNAANVVLRSETKSAMARHLTKLSAKTLRDAMVLVGKEGSVEGIMRNENVPDDIKRALQALSITMGDVIGHPQGEGGGKRSSGGAGAGACRRREGRCS